MHLPSEFLAGFEETGLEVVQFIERLCGDEEIAAMGLTGQMSGLMEAAFKDVPIVIVWYWLRDFDPCGGSRLKGPGNNDGEDEFGFMVWWLAGQTLLLVLCGEATGGKSMETVFRFVS